MSPVTTVDLGRPLSEQLFGTKAVLEGPRETPGLPLAAREAIGAPRVTQEAARDFPATELAVIGVDPGLHGGLSVLDPHGQALLCEDFPTFEVVKRPRKGTKERRSGEYDLPALFDLLGRARAVAQGASWVGCVLALEQLGPNPKNGVLSAWKVSRGMAIWEAWAVALGLRLERLHPKRWQKILSCDPGERAALVRARELFPLAPLTLAKHSGRAASLLIAEAGRRTL